MASPSETTTYYVSIIDKNNCSYEDSVKVNVIPEIIADFEYKIINGCESLPVVQFTNKSIGVEEFFWDFGDGSTSTEDNPVHEYQEEGTYTVSINIVNDICSDIKEITLPLRFFFIPNVFTPNDDNVNEYFEIITNVPVRLAIYNRWGKEIYKNADYKNEWRADGHPSGVYYYDVHLPDNTICKGWVQVLR
jgi:gliding motility-associated-like protein